MGTLNVLAEKGVEMPAKIEIRPLDKKETTGDSNANGT